MVTKINILYVYILTTMCQKAFMLTTQHRYHIRARPKGPCMGVGVFFFFKNDILILFQSRTEDLTHNVRAYVLDWVCIHVSSVYRSKIDMSF